MGIHYIASCGLENFVSLFCKMSVGYMPQISSSVLNINIALHYVAKFGGCIIVFRYLIMWPRLLCWTNIYPPSCRSMPVLLHRWKWDHPSRIHSESSTVIVIVWQWTSLETIAQIAICVWPRHPIRGMIMEYVLCPLTLTFRLPRWPSSVGSWVLPCCNRSGQQQKDDNVLIALWVENILKIEYNWCWHYN